MSLYGFAANAALSGFRPRDAAPRRLTQQELEELLARQYQPTPRPAEVTAVSQLDPEARKRARLDQLWTALAAMGTSISTGNWQNAARGVTDVQQVKRAALDEANARADQQWQEENRRAAADMEHEQQRQKVASLYGMYEKVTEGENPGGAFAQKAELAAKAGSMSELMDLYGQKPQRTAIRSKGLDPDAWDANTRLQADLQAEIQAQKDAADLEARRHAREVLDPLDVSKAAAVAGATASAEIGPRVALEKQLKAIWIAAEKNLDDYRHRNDSPGGPGGGGKDYAPQLVPWGDGHVLLDRAETQRLGRPVGVEIPGGTKEMTVQGSVKEGIPTRIYDQRTRQLLAEIDLETGAVKTVLPKKTFPHPLAPGAAAAIPTPTGPPPAPGPAPLRLDPAEVEDVRQMLGDIGETAAREQLRRAGHTPAGIGALIAAASRPRGER